MKHCVGLDAWGGKIKGDYHNSGIYSNYGAYHNYEEDEGEGEGGDEAQGVRVECNLAGIV